MCLDLCVYVHVSVCAWQAALLDGGTEDAEKPLGSLDAVHLTGMPTRPPLNHHHHHHIVSHARLRALACIDWIPLTGPT